MCPTTKLRKFVLQLPLVSSIYSLSRSKRDLLRENEELKVTISNLSLENASLRKLLSSTLLPPAEAQPPAHLKRLTTDLEPGHLTVSLLPTVSHSLFQRSSSSLPLKLDGDLKNQRSRRRNAFRWAKMSDLDALSEESMEEYSGDQAKTSSIDLTALSSIQIDRQLIELPENNSCSHGHTNFDLPNTISDLKNPNMDSLPAATKPFDISAFVIRDSIYPVHGGGYADVYSGVLSRNEKKTKVAIKVIRAHTYTEVNQWKLNKRLEREIRVWSCLRHPNIVPLLGITKAFGPHSGMVCPWMSEGDLNHYLKEQKFSLNLRKRLQILSDVVEGLIYLHTLPIVHGDLTTGNILIEDGKAHLSDFGLSKIMAETRSGSVLSSTVGGAIRWAAPELYHFGTDPNAVPAITRPCDVYSFGSVAFQVLSGKIPYDNISSDVQVLLELMKGICPARPEETLLTDAAWELITLCWTRDPYKRPNIEEVRRLLQSLRYSCSADLLESTITS